MWKRLKRSPAGLVGAFLVLITVSAAAFAPWLVLHDPVKPAPAERLKPPAFMEGGDARYPLGTDNLGRDLLSRTIQGARVSVLIGLASVAVAGAIGVAVGLIAGFAGGWVDSLLMRLVDGFMSIPNLLLTMLVLGITGPGLLTLIIVLGVTRWVSYARVVRGEVLSLKTREYVEAARASGSPWWRLILQHLLPNVFPLFIVLASTNVATVIMAEASLSFLGLGVPPSVPTWGAMLADGREYVASAWWVATVPGIALTLAVLGIVFLGDWLRDTYDPRLRNTA